MSKDLVRMDRQALPWSAYQLSKSLTNGKASLDIAIQRSFVWTTQQKSRLIYSLIENAPVPPLYASKLDGIYYIIDGKQRSEAIRSFLNNEFKLTSIPHIAYVERNEKGKEVEFSQNVNGLYFSDLSEEVRKAIENYSLSIYVVDSEDENKINDIFDRLNSGTPFNAIIKTRVAALSKDKIRELGKHVIFEKALTKKSIASYTNEDMVIKALYLLNGGTDLETKSIRKWISETPITDLMESDLSLCLDRLDEVSRNIELYHDAKVAKEILKKTHLVSMMPVLKEMNDDQLKFENSANIIYGFFSAKDKATVSDKYNDACLNGANKSAAVMTRVNELKKYYKGKKNKK